MMNMSVTAGIDLYLRKHPNLAESSVAIKSRAAGAPIESVRDYQDRHFLKNVVVVQGGESCRDCFLLSSALRRGLWRGPVSRLITGQSAAACEKREVAR